MSKAIRFVVSVVIMFLPSFMKVFVWRLQGHSVGKGCRIGCTYIDVKRLDLGDHVDIRSFSLIRGLRCVKLETGSKIGGGNWITGGGKGKFGLGRNSSIRRFHFFESSGNIYIGENTIVAGRGSMFYTHGLSPSDLNMILPINIGNWCYIGSASRFLPGSAVQDGTFVGMGAVVTKAHMKEYSLVAGNPATVKRIFSRDSLYFDRDFIRHNTHPDLYNG